MCVLKRFIRQRARPKRSIIEKWLHQEYMYYLSKYLSRAYEEAPLSWVHNASTMTNQEVFCKKETPIQLSHEEQKNVTTCITNNLECMTTFFEEYTVNYSMRQDKKANNLEKRQGRKTKNLENYQHLWNVFEKH